VLRDSLPQDVVEQSGLPFINHFPGVAAVGSKAKLAALSRDGKLPFLPRTFRMPAEFTAWQQFLATPEGAVMEWIRKNGQHRWGWVAQWRKSCWSQPLL
jgi:hypothetical protein